MKNALIATALLAALAAPMATPAPAVADGAASTRNIILGSAAAVGAGVLITNYNHKKRLKRQEQSEQARRQAASDSYRARFYRIHGYYPR